VLELAHYENKAARDAAAIAGVGSMQLLMEVKQWLLVLD
jgi:hypothetical protein